MTRTLRKMIRQKRLRHYIGDVGRTTLGRMIARGEFPAPIPLTDSGRAMAWFEDEVIAWQEARDAKERGQ